MKELIESVAHITCPTCERSWQVLSEEGGDWNEIATAKTYQDDLKSCEVCSSAINN